MQCKSLHVNHKIYESLEINYKIYTQYTFYINKFVQLFVVRLCSLGDNLLKNPYAHVPNMFKFVVTTDSIVHVWFIGGTEQHLLSSL